MVKKAFDPTDWDHRVLCEDPSCTGAIGPDGRCGACGLEYSGSLPFLKPEESVSGARDDSAEEKIRILLDKELEILAEIVRWAENAQEKEAAEGKREWYRATLLSAGERSTRIRTEIRGTGGL
jgi:hypothetical protein